MRARGADAPAPRGGHTPAPRGGHTAAPRGGHTPAPRGGSAPTPGADACTSSHVHPAVPTETPTPLWSGYDVVLLDLDGVVYSGTTPIRHAGEAIAALRGHGGRVLFVTNNASRDPAEAVVLLERVGVPAAAKDVVTSAQAAARELARRVPAGAKVLVVGAPALRAEVEAVGLHPAEGASSAVGVVQGFGPDVSWRALAEAVVAVRSGAVWIATNVDATLPSDRGPLPGNGALVAVVGGTAGARPVVTGKPEPGLHAEAVGRVNAQHPLVVGDRLDTDILGAARAGADSLLVLTGVTTARQLLAAPATSRPTYIGSDLRALLDPPVTAGRSASGNWECGGWSVSTSAGGPRLAGDGTPIDALRSLAAAEWEAADRAGSAAGADEAHSAPPARVEPAGEAARAALSAVGL